MPAIITNKFRIHNSEQFKESFSEAAGNIYYLGIGRPSPFNTATRADGRTDNLGTDIIPITPADNNNIESIAFDDLLAAKRISSSDIAFVAPRRNWISGTVYDIYRHDYGERITGTSTQQSANSGVFNLYDANFYVLNSQRNVYKCLDNNNNNSAGSTVEPTGTDTIVLSTADGYKWKYMYTLSASEQSNFLSTDFMAVSTNSSISSNAVDGAIDIVKIKTAGSGGADGTHANIPIRGDGTGGVVSVTVASGAVTAVNVTTPGSGYTFGTISNAQIVSAGATNLVGAELDVIIPPKGGHGFNALQELGAFFVMTNVSLEGTESANSGDVTVANDFRRVCLIRDPKSGGSAASANTLRATRAVQLTGVSGSFSVDEKITQSSTGAVGIVVEWDSTNSLLYYVQTKYNDEGIDANGNQTQFSGTNVITGAGGASGTPVTSSGTVNNVIINSGYSVPEIDHDSGDVLYVENRAPITRAADQTENIKLIIEF
ncbi:MAG: hypothetical protein CML81_01330 [Rhodobiaceae bacterium]|nr:hypothetical protein [Rhodobiaceae bacterium]RPF97694.1 MAG: hypothetical protein CBD87_001320 [Rhizobiales bacterium TMED227]